MKYILQRMMHGIVTIIMVSFIAFGLTNLLGDPVLQLLPMEHTKEQYMELRHELGYDRPFFVQYFDFVVGLGTGRIGESITFGQPALDVVLERLPVTASLAIGSFLVAIIIGIPLGVAAGYRPRSSIDQIAILIATIGQAIPSFVIAIFLILLFAVNLRVLPSGGWGTLSMSVLPIITLSLWSMSGLIRLARSGTKEVMSAPYILLARAKGLTEFQVLVWHALRPSLLPVVTFGGLQLATLLTGAVVAETIFAIPGIGRLVVNAVQARDQNIILATIMIGALGFVFINLVTDILLSVLDPRIRYRGNK